ncbi:GPI anchored protein, putative [Talaromyces stipitatus ATCC 10500]|uniref:GPI anchored protein, putative n=1 Tax=Talaromyces stipitatus (strain ATCC 10500 / CBS 375.48 / QM 6759 / NRRL 1006) TaxID=441959 RepID=B8MKK7_TALSN|nr:GPI anchored protein, putative [Talaromyces stipitatus ATCC 10500]EED15362.1 GPI anchored protein, putative [Talaromyces stipitatus ATCC 10500]
MRPFFSLALASVATAHFTLDWPVSRGFNEDTMPTFPCGGFNTPVSNRTVIALDAHSIPVDITFHHTQTAVSYLLALGNDPGSSFNITLGPTLAATGLGEFCLPDISLSSLNLTDGQNATLQVITDGDSGGGLFACADITFSSSVAKNSPSKCANNTGVTATALSGADGARTANFSNPDGSPRSASPSSSTSSGSSSTSATASAASSTHTGAAVTLETAGWGVLGSAFVACLALL